MGMQWDAGDMAQHWIDKLNSGTDAVAGLFLDPRRNGADMSYLGNRKGLVGGGKLSAQSFEKLKQDFERKMAAGLIPFAIYTIVLNEQTGFEMHGGEKLFELHEEGLSVFCETVQWTGIRQTPDSLRQLRRIAQEMYDRSIKKFVDELVLFKQVTDMGGKVIFNQ